MWKWKWNISLLVHARLRLKSMKRLWQLNGFAYIGNQTISNQSQDSTVNRRAVFARAICWLLQDDSRAYCKPKICRGVGSKRRKWRRGSVERRRPRLHAGEWQVGGWTQTPSRSDQRTPLRCKPAHGPCAFTTRTVHKRAILAAHAPGSR